MASEKRPIFLKRGYEGCSACGYIGDFDALTNSEREVLQWRCTNCYVELSPVAGIDREMPGSPREIYRLRLMQGDEYTEWPLA